MDKSSITRAFGRTVLFVKSNSPAILTGVGVTGLVATAVGRYECGEPSHVADYPFGEGMTVQECIEISSTDDGWNSTFDRRQIPLMRKLAQQCLLS